MILDCPILLLMNQVCFLEFIINIIKFTENWTFVLTNASFVFLEIYLVNVRVFFMEEDHNKLFQFIQDN